MNKYEVDKWRNTVLIIIERYDKTPLYGGIVGINTDSINTASVFGVLENRNKHQYDETLNRKLFTSVP
ncbi:MAG: hypothetical protein ABSG89_13180 [Bacteroidales bacterium]|jgi:hypothetical protein